MEVDPLPEDVRQYLRQYFTDVRDGASEGDYYVFSVKSSSGKRRELKVHFKLFFYSELVTAYLHENGFAAQLERGNVEITRAFRR
ncbi:MAG TPA: hypothetical protein VHW24_00070 [Bryobacteraceae bacterium]|jgi:hypothetical protein|nr:hypothetical protein [Bryobacteraceae bacterium]